MDYDKFAQLAGLSTINSGRATWSTLKKRLVAGPSSVVTASPTAATALQKRKRPAHTIVVDDSGSADVMPTPKKRRRSTSKSSYWYHRSSDPHRSPSRKAINAQNAASHPFAVDRVEPTLRVSKEPLYPEIARNTRDMILPSGNSDDDNLPATSKKGTQTTVAIIAKETIGRGNAAISSGKNNISGRSTTSKTITKSAMRKTKDMVWNRTYKQFLHLWRALRRVLFETHAVIDCTTDSHSVLLHYNESLRREVHF